MDATTAIALLGYVAGAVTSAASFPQVWKAARSRDVSAISAVTAGMFTLGAVMWLAYGFLIQSMPIILVNAFLIVGQGTLLTLKLVHGKKKVAVMPQEG